MTKLKNYKKTFLLAYPVSLAYLSHMITGVVDNIMVGRVGAEQLAASSLANNVMVIPMVFGLGVSFGLTPLVANAHGSKNFDKLNVLQQGGLIVNGGIGLLIFLLLISSSSIFSLLGQDELVVELAMPYYFVIALSMVPFMVFQNYKQLADGLSMTKAAMIISIAGNLLNIIFNYLLIFGEFGFPQLGLIGAGYATLAARVLMGLGMLWVLLYHTAFKQYKLKILSKRAFKFENLGNILKIGFPSGMQMVFEAGAFAVSAIMVGWIGYKELAAHQIAIGLASMTYVMAAGIGAASTIRVGNQLGMKDYSMVRVVGKTGIEMAAIFMFFSGLVFIIFNAILPQIYVDDNAVISIASGLIIISAGFQVFDGIQVAAMGALRGLSDVKWPTAIAAISYWFCGLPASYIMAFTFGWGVKGIWMGFIIGLATASVLLTLRFLRYSSKERMAALTIG